MHIWVPIMEGLQIKSFLSGLPHTSFMVLPPPIGPIDSSISAWRRVWASSSLIPGRHLVALILHLPVKRLSGLRWIWSVGAAEEVTLVGIVLSPD